MTDEYIETDEPIRINFTGVEGQRSFHLLPAGKYIAAPTDYSEGRVSDAAANAGARMINWEFTLESTIGGDIEVMTREGETIKVEGRRLFDNMVIIESSYWRMKAYLDAMWYDTSGEIELWPDEIIEEGTRLVLEVGIQRAKKDRKTGETYKARNVIRAFHPLNDEKPPGEPSVVAAEAPAEEATKEGSKSKVKAKAAKEESESEEAKV